MSGEGFIANDSNDFHHLDHPDSSSDNRHLQLSTLNSSSHDKGATGSAPECDYPSRSHQACHSEIQRATDGSNGLRIGRVGGRLRLIDNDGKEITVVRSSRMPQSDIHYGSDSSALSTTQEIDPEMLKSFRSYDYGDSLLQTSQQVNNAKDKDSETRQHTERTLEEQDTGHIQLCYEPTSPLQFSTGLHETISGDQTHLATDNELPLDPRTPAPRRPIFLQSAPVALMNESQLFEATQASPALGFTPGPAIPSSVRPSPDVWNVGEVSSRKVSSPLATRNGAISPAPPAIDLSSQAESEEINEDEDEDFTPRHASAHIAVSSFQRHGTEPRDQYISVQHSQRQKQQPLVGSSQLSNASDDALFYDEEFELKYRAKAIRQKAAKSLHRHASRTTMASDDENDVEVPSTAKRGRRRSATDDYIAQCEGFDARDSQASGVIRDSQGQPQLVTGSDKQNLKVGNTSPVPYASMKTTPGVNGSAKTATAPDSDNDVDSSPPANSEASTERLPSQAFQNLSGGLQHLFQTPATQRLSHLAKSDEIVPETSPTRPKAIPYGQGSDKTVKANDCSPQKSSRVLQIPINLEAFTPSPILPSYSLVKTSEKAGEQSFGYSNFDLRTTQSEILQGEISGSVQDHQSPTTQLQSTSSSALSHFASTPTDPNVSSPTIVTEVSSLGRENETEDGTQTMSMVNARSSPENDELEACVSITSEEGLRNLTEIRRVTDVSEASRNLGLNAPRSQRNKQPAVSESVEPEPAKHISVINTSVGSITTHPTRNPSSRTLRALSKSDNAKLPASTVSIKAPTRHSKRVAENERARSVDMNPTTPTKMRRFVESSNNSSGSGLFSNMVFCVSYVSRQEEKSRVVKLLEQHGGLILENGFDELFEAPSSAPTTPSTLKRRYASEGEICHLSLKPMAERLGFACLIADEHSRRAKYMQALALGLPCISGFWVLHCVSTGKVLPWGAYMLAAGKSDFLGGAVRSRVLATYPAETSKIVDVIALRPKLLQGKNILLVTRKGKAEETRRPYHFLTQASGASSVKRVLSIEEARKALLEAHESQKSWDWVYVDSDKHTEMKDTEKLLFGLKGGKRKRSSVVTDHSDNDTDAPDRKKTRLVGDEYIIQSLIFGGLMDFDEAQP